MRRLVLVFLIISFSQVFNQSESKVRFENFQWKVNPDSSITMSINFYQNIYDYKDLKMGFVWSDRNSYPELFCDVDKAFSIKSDSFSFSITNYTISADICYYIMAFIFKEPIKSDEIYYSDVYIKCFKI